MNAITNEAKAAHILSETVAFLAKKYGCTTELVVAALADKDAKVCNDFAELASTGVQVLA